MHVSHGFRSLLGLSLVILLSGPRLALSQQPSQSGPSTGTAELRWTPHRAASSPQAVTTDTSATTAPAAVLATAATPSVPLAASQPPAPLKVPTATRIAAPRHKERERFKRRRSAISSPSSMGRNLGRRRTANKPPNVKEILYRLRG